MVIITILTMNTNRIIITLITVRYHHNHSDSSRPDHNHHSHKNTYYNCHNCLIAAILNMKDDTVYIPKTF